MPRPISKNICFQNPPYELTPRKQIKSPKMSLGLKSLRRRGGAMPANGKRPVYRFSHFEVDAQDLELRKHGVRIKLQEQPFRLLEALLQQPGTLVTREELHARLWPDDTFVDFDH